MSLPAGGGSHTERGTRGEEDDLAVSVGGDQLRLGARVPLRPPRLAHQLGPGLQPRQLQLLQLGREAAGRRVAVADADEAGGGHQPRGDDLQAPSLRGAEPGTTLCRSLLLLAILCYSEYSRDASRGLHRPAAVPGVEFEHGELAAGGGDGHQGLGLLVLRGGGAHVHVADRVIHHQVGDGVGLLLLHQIPHADNSLVAAAEDTIDDLRTRTGCNIESYT